MIVSNKKRIIIFRTDRIGDLINSSSFFKSIKNYYDNSEIDVVCSSYNCEIAKRYDFINKVITYNKNQNFINKIIFFFKIAFNYYDICIVIDGKTISKLTSFFIRAKKKYIICFYNKLFALFSGIFDYLLTFFLGIFQFFLTFI